MAVAQVHQREIVEVPFMLPDGQILPHPALVISCDELQNVEPGLFYAVLVSTKNHHPELTIPIKSQPYFDHVIDRIIATIVDGDWE